MIILLIYTGFESYAKAHEVVALVFYHTLKRVVAKGAVPAALNLAYGDLVPVVALFFSVTR